MGATKTLLRRSFKSAKTERDRQFTLCGAGLLIA